LLLDLLYLICGFSGLLVKLLANLLLESDLSTHLLLLELGDIIRLEREVQLLEHATPLRDHLSKAARGVRTSEDRSLREPLCLHKHVEAAIDLSEHIVSLKRNVKLAEALSFGSQFH